MICRIGFLLVPRFSALGFLCAAEPLRVANRLAETRLYAWDVISVDGAPVAASNGMRLEANRNLAEVAHPTAPRLDWFVICAGFSPLAGCADTTARLLAGMGRRGTHMGGIDTGAFLLARAGLGRDTAMTMHWEARPAFLEAFPDWKTSGELFEDHGSIFTCAGGTASIDLMLGRIAARRGAAFARGVSEQFIHAAIRPSHDAQKPPPRAWSTAHGRHLKRAIGLMEQALDRRVALAELTGRAACSERHLERMFHRAFGRGAAAHHRGLRLARARTLLRETALSVTEIAAATGFESRSTFSRAYRTEFGIPPAGDRIEP